MLSSNRSDSMSKFYFADALGFHIEDYLHKKIYFDPGAFSYYAPTLTAAEQFALSDKIAKYLAKNNDGASQYVSQIYWDDSQNSAHHPELFVLVSSGLGVGKRVNIKISDAALVGIPEMKMMQVPFQANTLPKALKSIEAEYLEKVASNTSKKVEKIQHRVLKNRSINPTEIVIPPAPLKLLPKDAQAAYPLIERRLELQTKTLSTLMDRGHHKQFFENRVLQYGNQALQASQAKLGKLVALRQLAYENESESSLKFINAQLAELQPLYADFSQEFTAGLLLDISKVVCTEIDAFANAANASLAAINYGNDLALTTYIKFGIINCLNVAVSQIISDTWKQSLKCKDPTSFREEKIAELNRVFSPLIISNIYGQTQINIDYFNHILENDLFVLEHKINQIRDKCDTTFLVSSKNLAYVNSGLEKIKELFQPVLKTFNIDQPAFTMQRKNNFSFSAALKSLPGKEVTNAAAQSINLFYENLQFQLDRDIHHLALNNCKEKLNQLDALDAKLDQAVSQVQTYERLNQLAVQANCHANRINQLHIKISEANASLQLLIPVLSDNLQREHKFAKTAVAAFKAMLKEVETIQQRAQADKQASQTIFDAAQATNTWTQLAEQNFILEKSIAIESMTKLESDAAAMELQEKQANEIVERLSTYQARLTELKQALELPQKFEDLSLAAIQQQTELQRESDIKMQSDQSIKTLLLTINHDYEDAISNLKQHLSATQNLPNAQLIPVLLEPIRTHQAFCNKIIFEMRQQQKFYNRSLLCHAVVNILMNRDYWLKQRNFIEKSTGKFSGAHLPNAILALENLIAEHADWLTNPSSQHKLLTAIIHYAKTHLAEQQQRSVVKLMQWLADLNLDGVSQVRSMLEQPYLLDEALMPANLGLIKSVSQYAQPELSDPTAFNSATNASSLNNSPAGEALSAKANYQSQADAVSSPKSSTASFGHRNHNKLIGSMVGALLVGGAAAPVTLGLSIPTLYVVMIVAGSGLVGGGIGTLVSSLITSCFNSARGRVKNSGRAAKDHQDCLAPSANTSQQKKSTTSNTLINQELSANTSGTQYKSSTPFANEPDYETGKRSTPAFFDNKRSAPPEKVASLMTEFELILAAKIINNYFEPNERQAAADRVLNKPEFKTKLIANYLKYNHTTIQQWAQDLLRSTYPSLPNDPEFCQHYDKILDTKISVNHSI